VVVRLFTSSVPRVGTLGIPAQAESPAIPAIAYVRKRDRRLDTFSPANHGARTRNTVTDPASRSLIWIKRL
jgi:hypothetical protein